MTLKASDFVFAVLEEGESLVVAVVTKEFWDGNHCLDDRGAPDDLKAHWPADIGMFEDAESVFQVEEDFTLEEVRDKFLAAGLIHQPLLEDLFV